MPDVTISLSKTTPDPNTGEVSTVELNGALWVDDRDFREMAGLGPTPEHKIKSARFSVNQDIAIGALEWLTAFLLHGNLDISSNAKEDVTALLGKVRLFIETPFSDGDTTPTPEGGE